MNVAHACSRQALYTESRFIELGMDVHKNRVVVAAAAAYNDNVYVRDVIKSPTALITC